MEEIRIGRRGLGRGWGGRGAWRVRQRKRGGEERWMGVQLRGARRASHPRPLRSLPPRVCSPQARPHSDRAAPSGAVLRAPPMHCGSPHPAPSHPRVSSPPRSTPAGTAPPAAASPHCAPQSRPVPPTPASALPTWGVHAPPAAPGRLLRAGRRLPPGPRPSGPPRPAVRGAPPAQGLQGREGAARRPGRSPEARGGEREKKGEKVCHRLAGGGKCKTRQEMRLKNAKG